MITEKPVTFKCEGSQLIGLVADAGSETGLLIVVGGPQYRIGSHRQFVSLARAVANSGFSTLRFDYRGMGDSEGELLGFEHIEKDLDAALELFLSTCQDLKKVVVWGLCDGASAAMIYAGKESRLKGLILLNPWLRTDKTQAQTLLRHYYLARLLSGAWWKKIISGKFEFFRSLKDAVSTFFLAFCVKIPKVHESDISSPKSTTIIPYPQQMLDAMHRYSGPILVILSGQDLTAAEFLDVTTADRNWSSILNRDNVQCKTVPLANHTFSDPDWKRQVEDLTIDRLRQL